MENCEKNKLVAESTFEIVFQEKVMCNVVIRTTKSLGIYEQLLVLRKVQHYIDIMLLKKQNALT